MTIRIATGDLFESSAQTYANAVNTRGVMGKGIALAFKKKFPEMFEDYAIRCRKGEVRLGEPYHFPIRNEHQLDRNEHQLELFSEAHPPDGDGRPSPTVNEAPQIILNFPTKGHWREPARLDAIRDGLEHLAANFRGWGITSLAVPALGCGEGHLRWEDVRPVLETGLEQLGIPVTLYSPLDRAPTSQRSSQPGFFR